MPTLELWQGVSRNSPDDGVPNLEDDSSHLVALLTESDLDRDSARQEVRKALKSDRFDRKSRDVRDDAMNLHWEWTTYWPKLSLLLSLAGLLVYYKRSFLEEHELCAGDRLDVIIGDDVGRSEVDLGLRLVEPALGPPEHQDGTGGYGNGCHRRRRRHAGARHVRDARSHRAG